MDPDRCGSTATLFFGRQWFVAFILTTKYHNLRVVSSWKVVIRPDNESSGVKAEHVDFLLCRRPECHSGFSSSVCKVSVTHEGQSFSVNRLSSDLNPAARLTADDSNQPPLIHSLAPPSVTLSLTRSHLCRPLSAHGGDDPAGSLQDSLGLQRGLHRRRPEPQHHQRGRQLRRAWQHCSTHRWNDCIGLFLFPLCTCSSLVQSDPSFLLVVNVFPENRKPSKASLPTACSLNLFPVSLGFVEWCHKHFGDSCRHVGSFFLRSVGVTAHRSVGLYVYTAVVVLHCSFLTPDFFF